MASPAVTIASLVPVFLRPLPGHERAALAAWQRLYIVGLSLVATLLLGTLGHMLIGHMSFFDAFYFTLITLAAIGYGEPANMTQLQRVFNTGLIIIGLALVALATATVVQLILELELDPRRRQMERAIATLKDHYIICGAGRVGRHIVTALRQRNIPLVVIESDVDLVAELREQGVLAMLGDATHDATLLAVSIGTAKGMVAAVGDHAVNAFIVLTGKALNPQLHIVARADDEGDELKMRKVGADRVLFPTRLGSMAMANALTRPAVASYLEWAITLDGVDLEMDEIVISSHSNLQNRSLAQVDLRSRFKATVIAVRRQNGDVIYNPGAETVIHGGDIWIVVGQPDELLALREIASRAA